VFLVSVSAYGEMIRLRRYDHDGTSRPRVTHMGCYAPGGVTPTPLEYYRQHGARQDEAPHARRRQAGRPGGRAVTVVV
jgi:hypothetical protein